MLMAFDKVIPLLHAIIRGFEVRIEQQSSERETERERESSVRLLAHSTRRSYIAHTHTQLQSQTSIDIHTKQKHRSNCNEINEIIRNILQMTTMKMVSNKNQNYH